MARQPGIDHPLDLRMRLAASRAIAQRVRAVALHAQRQGLAAAQREEAVERVRDRADRVLQESQLLGELGVVR